MSRSRPRHRQDRRADRQARARVPGPVLGAEEWTKLCNGPGQRDRPARYLNRSTIWLAYTRGPSSTVTGPGLLHCPGRSRPARRLCLRAGAASSAASPSRWSRAKSALDAWHAGGRFLAGHSRSPYSGRGRRSQSGARRRAYRENALALEAGRCERGRRQCRTEAEQAAGVPRACSPMSLVIVAGGAPAISPAMPRPARSKAHCAAPSWSRASTRSTAWSMARPA